MKRDLDLIRELLFLIESHDRSEAINSDDIEIDNYSSTQIGLHLNMMADAGFLVMEPWLSSTNSDRVIKVAYVFDLSWKGHEHLDVIRDPVIWKKTKTFSSKVGSASFEVVIGIATSLAKDALSKLGINIA